MPASESRLRATQLLGERAPGPAAYGARRRAWAGYRMTGAHRHDAVRLEHVHGTPLLILPSVFNPRLLRTGAFFARVIAAQRLGAGGDVLDLGTGSGVCAVFAARHARRVVAVDINRAAVRCAELNAQIESGSASIAGTAICSIRWPASASTPSSSIRRSSSARRPATRDCAWRSVGRAGAFRRGPGGAPRAAAAVPIYCCPPSVMPARSSSRSWHATGMRCRCSQRAASSTSASPILEVRAPAAREQHECTAAHPADQSGDHRALARAFSAVHHDSGRGARAGLPAHAHRRQPGPRCRCRAATAAARSGEFIAAGITVMGGPQVATAIEMSRALRAARPALPIVWGGYFPTLYPERRAQQRLRGLRGARAGRGDPARVARRHCARRAGALDAIAGLGFRRDGRPVCNRERGFSARHIAPALRYDLLPDPRAYLVKTFLGARTAAHQAALGCRFRCTFCGVAAMFRGGTALPPAERLDSELAFLKQRHRRRLDPVLRSQFLRSRSRHGAAARGAGAPRAAVVVLCARRRAGESLGRILAAGAQEPPAHGLHRRRDAQRQTTALHPQGHALRPDARSGRAVPASWRDSRSCRSWWRRPRIPKGETERTFDFIRQVKRVNPQAEIIVYVYTPLPAEQRAGCGAPRAGAAARCRTARRWSFRARRRSGPSGAGWTTPATPMRRG